MPKNYGGKLVEIFMQNAKSFNIHNKDIIDNNLVYSFTFDMQSIAQKAIKY